VSGTSMIEEDNSGSSRRLPMINWQSPIRKSAV
jgi:hypothetical protein